MKVYLDVCLGSSLSRRALFPTARTFFAGFRKDGADSPGAREQGYAALDLKIALCLGRAGGVLLQ